MNEKKVADILKSEGVDLIASLPCDRNKKFTSEIHEEFDVIDLTREEDGAGICAGAFMAGRKPAMSIQSSGLGNMMNAVMSLTSLYGFPLPILASWRGVDNEKIEAQKPFNLRLPQMLDAFGIEYAVVKDGNDLNLIEDMVRRAFDGNAVTVALIRPGFWSDAPAAEQRYPARSRTVSIRMDKKIAQPSMTRLEAIRQIMQCIGDDDIVVSNIGVPSKEVFASRDRNLNFYMLGSYTQATPIGLGIAVSTEKRVFVIDGDGSILGSSVLPVVASVCPDNLTVICLDNGTFGSTGDQVNSAYVVSDTEAMAKACGIKNTLSVSDEEGIGNAMRYGGDRCGALFVQVLIKPSNSDSPNIEYSAEEIKKRFMENI
ncbi:MAG: sulfopyruvate decarboxylase subunit alpha [Candidatus Methanoplasma sp.]|jgi:sulfopyruvate decarboxylase subunit beta|nr:sulfopyruvate decarboxylase subunit alpha [Candidatus Methanoplasma sp.]